MRRICLYIGLLPRTVSPLILGKCRWHSEMTSGDKGAADEETVLSEAENVGESTTQTVMERATEARRAIHTLWLSAESLSDQDRRAQVCSIISQYKLSPSTPREEDVSRGLGDAFDRLVLLCLPFGSGPSSSTDELEGLLQLAGRNGRELSVRTIQHLFARTDSFAEAIAVFYSMRRCHVAMNMEAYYAMLYSLQRLEEEGWGRRFHDEFKQSGCLSEQAMDFVMKGVGNALLPENKPWLGRIMFQDRDAPVQRRGTKDYDEMNVAWMQRYKDGASSPAPPSG
uniref:Uncharacterized protein n=1 Tax=Trypanosoma vivax (strain Y486) TaxID=1055687 RepID=G0UD54_TRYVY|nr:conserved hypothetical protein [Trypanosoma vivax Y486]